nr:hypothetical protein [Arthrospira sp. PLM2.Bin9]
MPIPLGVRRRSPGGLLPFFPFSGYGNHCSCIHEKILNSEQLNREVSQQWSMIHFPAYRQPLGW